MEGITRLVSESLARHGFDRPLDYRRLHWSRWFRCESHHSLLFVPSKPGVFAFAEEIMDFIPGKPQVGADAFIRPAETGSARPNSAGANSAQSQTVSTQTVWDRTSDPLRPSAARQPLTGTATADARVAAQNRMLAVTQFFEDDDMAFVLDRMIARQNPMRARLASGRYFVRFVVIEDQAQRRSICSALNQWLSNSGEKISGIGAHFATSQDASVSLGQKSSSEADTPQANPVKQLSPELSTPHLDSVATNIHCPQPLPSGF